jgi:hypothetical protein
MKNDIFPTVLKQHRQLFAALVVQLPTENREKNGVS